MNKIKTKITVRIKSGYYLELLTPETMELLGSTKSKITKGENIENVPHLEITELVLVHWNIVNDDYQQDLDMWFKLIGRGFYLENFEINI